MALVSHRRLTKTSWDAVAIVAFAVVTMVAIAIALNV
jgi:hypothetical protein